MSVEPQDYLHDAIAQALGFSPNEVDLKVMFGEEELPCGCTAADGGLQDGSRLGVHVKRREEVGNEIGDRSHCDSWCNFNLVCPALRFDSDGSIVAWKFFARNDAGVKMQVYRQEIETTYKLVGSNTLPTAEGINLIAVPSEERIAVRAGDVIGMRQMHLSAIPSDISNDLPIIHWAPNQDECWPLGTEMCFSGGSQGRDYAVHAVVVYE